MTDCREDCAYWKLPCRPFIWSQSCSATLWPSFGFCPAANARKRKKRTMWITGGQCDSCMRRCRLGNVLHIFLLRVAMLLLETFWRGGICFLVVRAARLVFWNRRRLDVPAPVHARPPDTTRWPQCWPMLAYEWLKLLWSRCLWRAPSSQRGEPK